MNRYRLDANQYGHKFVEDPNGQWVRHSEATTPAPIDEVLARHLAIEVLGILTKDPLGFGALVAGEKYGNTGCVEAIKPRLMQALVDIQRAHRDEAQKVQRALKLSNDTKEHYGKLLDEAIGEQSQLRSTITRLKEALTKAGQSVCSLKCPSTWKTGEKPPHSDECQVITALLAD